MSFDATREEFAIIRHQHAEGECFRYEPFYEARGTTAPFLGYVPWAGTQKGDTYDDGTPYFGPGL